MTLICQVCEKENPEHLFHCEDHYFCIDCETRSDLITCSEGVLCHSCRDKRIENQIANFNSDTDFEDEAVCPHCGYKHSDSWEMSDGECSCSNCDRAFELTINTEVTYSTSKS